MVTAGLMRPDQGNVTVSEEIWFDSSQNINLSPQKRKIGYVFQDYALFPNMTVQENLEFALSSKQNRKKVDELMEVIALVELKKRKPETLSGGQKQRVALARALVQQPKILLLDEPLSAIDAKMRSRLQDYILKVHREYNLTTLLVSHDIGEIIKLSDKVIVIENGEITKQDHPNEVFVNREISGKFKFVGEVLNIEQEDIVFIVTVLIQTNLVKVIAQQSEIAGINVGDRVMVAAKAFSPLLYKLEAKL